VILIPAPALWEVSFLEQHDQIKLDKPYEDWARELFAHPCYDCIPLDATIIAKARKNAFGA
jgi:PIN domain nuclease of toxin-antitoxin system